MLFKIIENGARIDSVPLSGLCRAVVAKQIGGGYGMIGHPMWTVWDDQFESGKVAELLIVELASYSAGVYTFEGEFSFNVCPSVRPLTQVCADAYSRDLILLRPGKLVREIRDTIIEIIMSDSLIYSTIGDSVKIQVLDSLRSQMYDFIAELEPGA